MCYFQFSVIDKLTVDTILQKYLHLCIFHIEDNCLYWSDLSRLYSTCMCMSLKHVVSDCTCTGVLWFLFLLTLLLFVTDCVPVVCFCFSFETKANQRNWQKCFLSVTNAILHIHSLYYFINQC